MKNQKNGSATIIEFNPTKRSAELLAKADRLGFNRDDFINECLIIHFKKAKTCTLALNISAQAAAQLEALAKSTGQTLNEVAVGLLTSQIAVAEAAKQQKPTSANPAVRKAWRSLEKRWKTISQRYAGAFRMLEARG